MFSVTKQVARPIFFATLIIITVYLPLFAFERAEAKLFLPMAYTVSYALLGALLCTCTLIPGLAYMAFRKPRKVFHNRPLERLQAGFGKALGRMLATPKIAFLLGGMALAAVVALGLTTGREFLPELDEGALWLQVQLPTGISLDKASEMASELRRTLREFPEVSYAVTQLGRSDDGTDAWTPSHIEAPVGLKPYNTWPKGETKEEFLRKLNARLKQLPGFSIGISQPIIDMVEDAIGGAHSPLVVRVIGDDFNELRRIGNRDCRCSARCPRHNRRIHLPGTSHSPGCHRRRPRSRGSLRHKRVRHHQSDPDRGWRRRGEQGLRGRPHLRHYREVPERNPQQSGSAGETGPDHSLRRADPAFAGCPHQAANRRKHNRS